MIGTKDLTDVVKNMLVRCPYSDIGKEWETKSCECVLYKEVMLLYNMSLKMDILVEQKNKRLKIDFPRFLSESGIQISCLVIEMQNFLLKGYRTDLENEMALQMKIQQRQEQFRV